MRSRAPRTTYHVLLAWLVLTSTACGHGWARAKPEGLTASPKQQVVRVWCGGQYVEWHGIRVTPDSVTGVPFFLDTECATCRRSIARTAIDSIQVARPDENSRSSLGILFAVLGGLMLAALGQMAGMP